MGVLHYVIALSLLGLFLYFVLWFSDQVSEVMLRWWEREMGRRRG